MGDDDRNGNVVDALATHIVTSQDMQYTGLRLVGFSNRKVRKAAPLTNYRRFKSQFGVSAATASRVYADLQETAVEEARINGDNNQLRFFLMGLHYLRKYPTEDDLEAKFNYSNFWARQKVWGIAKRIRALKVEKIFWDNDGTGPWDLSVDGTHCARYEPQHPEFSQDRKTYSHKCNRAGWDYELGIRLHKPQLAWMSGPHPAGVHDITVFREKGLLDELQRRGKKAIGDGGYCGEPKYISSYNAFDNKGVRLFKSRALKRHENFNNLIKQFGILNGVFRHSRERFAVAFEAVCILCQYRIENEIPLYDILIEDVVNKFRNNA
eukprot:scaffold4993_cov73-Cylindrotheca_fusiformis.AAC.1